MQRDEVEALLLAHARVAPAFTGLVWDRLVAQNEAFFERRAVVTGRPPPPLQGRTARAPGGRAGAHTRPPTPPFPRSYFTRCRLKDQIVAYNALLLQLQALLQQGAAAAAAAFGGGDGLQFAADATPHGGDGDGGGGGDRWWPLSLSRRGTEEDE